MRDTHPKDVAMSSRDEILKAVRKPLVQAVDLPDLKEEWIRYADPLAQFVEVLESVGGRWVVAENADAANAELARIPAYRDAGRIFSGVPGIGAGNVDLEAIDDPHDLEDVDYAILPGDFAVAENAAVWVTDAGLKHRVIFFLPQHLALVVPADEILHNMHEAYDWLANHLRPDDLSASRFERTSITDG